MISNPICLRVKGPFACFTRPEFKVERVSYMYNGGVDGVTSASGLLQKIPLPNGAVINAAPTTHWSRISRSIR
jgi:hypothetical protein